ncbi:glutamate receptor 2.2-like [Telopea speciosissima]|uniref:glutamate receptor 2.2-like n=1 Tax=Telopea speciosissima TaxID=54955 RepID=UPI001CC5EC03|nr:glutamate receptor 2.2-like [Telopea speciosissima]
MNFWAYLPPERHPMGSYYKLSDRKLGPLEVLARINPNAYRLKLPSHMKIHDVFNVLHLTPFVEDSSNDEDSNSETNSFLQGGNDAAQLQTTAEGDRESRSRQNTPNSVIGKVAERCISMALSDFYAVHPNYNSKIVLHVRDSRGDAVNAASAALDLIKNVGVQAIIGPQTSEEAEFLAKMGSMAHVPIISFSTISSSLSPTQFPYFIRFAQNDSSQVKAIAAVLKAYEYKEVTLIHDNTHRGTAAVPYLIDGLQEIGTHVLRRIVLHHDMKGSEIEDILCELGGKSTRGVFIVHLSLSLGSQFFLHVKEMGMMKSSGFSYKWIIMSGLTDLMRYMEPSLLSSMNDVIGIKTRVPLSGPHRRFMAQWRKQFGKDHSKERLQLNVYGLWAYDATFVAAKAVNRASLCLNGEPPWSPLLSESKV